MKKMGKKGNFYFINFKKGYTTIGSIKLSLSQVNASTYEESKRLTDTNKILFKSYKLNKLK